MTNTVKLKTNSPQTNLSKWEKYHSPQSDEDLNLNLETVKSKVKDFSVIEKPSKLNLTSQIEKNINRSIDIDKVGHIGTVFTRSRNTDSTDKGFLNEATRMQNVPNNPDQLKLPSSLSSMDSFDQLLADDKLDFDDPELDHLLLKHTNIEEKNGKTAQKNSSKSTCKRENSKSFPEYKPKSNSIQDRNLNCVQTSLDNNAAEKVECLKNISDSDISFSLDDSFTASNTYHSLKTESNSRSSVSLRVPWKQEAGKGNSSCRSSAIENINGGANKETAGQLSCKNRLNDGSSDKFMECNSEKDCTYGDRAVTEAALVQNDVNLKRRGESISTCINRLNSSCDNFMGYDSEEDCSQGNRTVIDTPSVQKPCSHEIRSNCINRLIDPCEDSMGYNGDEDGSNGDRVVEKTDLVHKLVNKKPNGVTKHNSGSNCDRCKLSVCSCMSDRQDFKHTLDKPKPEYEMVSSELSKPGSQVLKRSNLNQTTKFNKRYAYNLSGLYPAFFGKRPLAKIGKK